MLRRLLRTPEILVFLVSLWIALTCNTGYWRIIAENAPSGGAANLLFILSFLALTIGLISLVMLILTMAGGTRFVLSTLLMVAAAAGYFTSRLGILFDSGMLVNVLETNPAEAFELINLSLVVSVAVFGLAPAILIWRLPPVRRRFRSAVMHKGAAFLLALALIGGPLYADQKEIVSVVRNHHELRHMIAPLNVVAATYTFVRDELESPAEFEEIALDAHHVSAISLGQRPTVLVLIIGETARAANFSLNGYERDTNSELEQRAGVHFIEAASCGTATATSLPCIFSLQEHSNFDRDVSRNQDNLLDIVTRAGYDVFWVDNGNGCKGICSRVTNRDVHQSTPSPACPDGECFDESLADELEGIVATVTADTLVILHQLGSHGPAYYRRYPDAYRIFQPDCRSPNFGDCSVDEITNAYDNTIAYTDHVIASAIDVLSGHSDAINPSLIYISDHGESLGEHNLFLHGMPYKLAPDEQTRVPLIWWLGDNTMQDHEIESGCDLETNTATVSHDNIFHTVLGLLAVRTSVYKPEMDIFMSCRTQARKIDVAS